MKILRDLYRSLSPRDRAIVWLSIGLGAAIGFGGVLISEIWSRPSARLAPPFTAPPFEMRLARATP